MKKTGNLLNVILTGAMILSLTACSSGSSSTSTTAAETTAAAEKNTEAASETEENADTAAGDVTWPNGTVTVVVPAAAGSTVDLAARIYTTSLQKTTGAAFVITNDTTGNGTVAYENVRNAKPDGQTLLYTQNLFIQARGGVYNEEPWDSFDVIANGGSSIEQYILVVRSGEEYTNWEEFVEYAKAHPGELVAGIQNGGQAHMLQAMLQDQAGIECQMVEAGSSADKITGLLGGYIDVAFVSTQTGVGYTESGELIALMTTGPEKSGYNSEWPTSAELGYPDVTMLTKVQLFGPKGMDEALKETINTMWNACADDDDVIDQLAKLSMTPASGNVKDAEEIAKNSDELLQEGYSYISQ